jgi:hypothetical protein
VYDFCSSLFLRIIEDYNFMETGMFVDRQEELDFLSNLFQSRGDS